MTVKRSLRGIAGFFVLLMMTFLNKPGLKSQGRHNGDTTSSTEQARGYYWFHRVWGSPPAQPGPGDTPDIQVIVNKTGDQLMHEVGSNVFFGDERHTFFNQFHYNANVYFGVRYSF